ncbi:MAG: hypothetical protein KF708_03060 [Pirellulales bacterium]|nr:hypothetical protein [Pirellulales bacterium]
MDPFRFCLALLPLGVYLVVLGGLQLSRRPILVSGGRDLAALGLALSGIAIIGPIELFLPRAAANTFGVYVWPLVMACYFLLVILAVLTARPRLTAYNVSLDELRPLLGEVALGLDADARWAGASLSLPRLGVELHIEEFSPMHNVALVAANDRQRYDGWHRLERALRARLAQVPVARDPRGVLLLALGLLLFSAAYARVAFDPVATQQAFVEMVHP